MEDSPFQYGTVLNDANFANRKTEIDQLYRNLSKGINTSIISPRRWGKSSLVEKVIHKIRQEKETKVVLIDLFSITSEESFLEQFAKEVIKASSSKWEEWLQSGKKFFKRLIPKFSLGIDPQNDFSISFDWKELALHKDEILNLPETIAQKKKLRFVICLDEFQDLASFRNFEAFEKQLRAVWQRQERCCYCLYGSKRHMMSDIFTKPSKPFYKFGDIMFLTKIEKKHWLPFIHERFESSGKTIETAAAAFIVDKMERHSWYVQQLSDYSWNQAHKTIGITEVKTALVKLVQTNIPFFQEQVEHIKGTKFNLLVAIANGEIHLTSTEVMDKYRLGTPNNVSKNRKALMKADVIELNEKGDCEFLDPVFEMWFNQQFLNRPYVNA